MRFHSNVTIQNVHLTRFSCIALFPLYLILPLPPLPPPTHSPLTALNLIRQPPVKASVTSKFYEPLDKALICFDRMGKYKLIWGCDGARDGWENNPMTPDGPTFSWDIPANMLLLGLDPEADKIVRPPGVLPSRLLSPTEFGRFTSLIQMRRFNPAVQDVTVPNGKAQLYNLEGKRGAR